MARILFCEQYFYPEGWGGAELPRDIALRLREQGHDVAVLCGSDPYVPVQGDPGPDPAAAGIELLRVPRLISGEARQRKLLRQAWFYLFALRLLVLRRGVDIYLVQTNPPLIVVLVAMTARLFGKPLVVIAQDLYPEAIVAHGVLPESSFAIRVLARLFSWAYRQATTVVSLGDTMSRRLLAKGVRPERIREISNWATGPDGVVRGAANALRGEWGLEGRFVLLYSGNLGIGHEFQTLVDAVAAVVESEPRLTLVVIGRGGRLDEVRRSVQAKALEPRVQFRDFVPASRLPESLGIADVALVTLRPGFEGLIVPSKVLGYMARGLPVLYIGPPGDTRNLLDRADCGAGFANGDVEGVARWLLAAVADATRIEAMGRRGRQFYERELSRDLGLGRYVDVVADCLRRPDGRS